METIRTRIIKKLKIVGAMRPAAMDKLLRLKPGRAGSTMWEMWQDGMLAKEKQGGSVYYYLPEAKIESEPEPAVEPKVEHPQVVVNAVDAVVALSNENARLKAALKQANDIIATALESTHG